jgi:CubicO group peptidase (beta-lactamase class C family)
MTRGIGFGFVGFTSLVICFSAQAVSDGIANGIRTYLQKCVAAQAPVRIGLVIGLVDTHGTRIICSGKLDRDGTEQDVGGDTVFEIGSVTKTFTALLLEELVQRGQARLDDSVATCLPGSVKMPRRNGRDITLVQLATHTSGLPNVPGNLDPQRAENPYADYTIQNLHAFLSAYRLKSDPGSEWRYSNLGLGLLGHILELKTGTNYEALLVDRICTPLKMDSTRITLTPELESRFAKGHNELGESVRAWDLPALAGAGAIRSTANDLLKYVSANLGLVSSWLTPLMEKTHVIHFERPNGPHMGLAWFNTTGRQRARLVWHDGRTAGCSAFIGFDKDRKCGVVILSNSEGVFDCRRLGLVLLECDWQSADDITRALPEIAAPTKRPVAISLDIQQLDACTGRYQFPPSATLPEGAVITIRREGDQLVWQAKGDNVLPGALQLFPESETNFFIKINGARLTFLKNRAGAITAVAHHQSGLPDLEARKLDPLPDKPR